MMRRNCRKSSHRWARGWMARSGIALAAVTTLLASVMVGSAPAATDSGPLSVTVAASPAAEEGARSAAALAPVITCEIQAQNPHNSTHVPGTVNVVGTTRCDHPVASILMRIVLYKNGTPVASGISGRVVGASAQVNAATPCSPGVYTGLVAFWIVFPPLYFPPSGVGLVRSSSVSITCTTLPF